MLEKFFEKGRWNEHKGRRKLRIDAAWWFARMLGAKPCANPVFICGCGHSGTSLVLRILGEHSAMYAVPYESRCGESLAPATVFRKFDIIAWARTVAWTRKRCRWLEKTPGNVRHLEKLMAHFPAGKFLIIIRDGRDVAASLKKRGYTLADAIDRWVNDNRAGEKFWNHPRVMKFTYEELVTQTQATLEKILGFLGEPLEDGLLRHHEKPRAMCATDAKKNNAAENGSQHREHRSWQINQPVFDGRGKWKNELSADDVAFIEQRAGAMLREYGYR